VKTYIHVNQHKIKRNAKLPPGEEEGVLTIKTYKEQLNGFEAKVYHHGEVVAKVVYRPHSPLGCGAHCWIETDFEVLVDDCIPIGGKNE
tara:strand:+ start:1680 stop:1946 length:267 start_codon:yes stop_codon:yes gene_type:complete